MRLTVFTDYSLRVLLVLASRTDALVTIADIASAFEISDAHLMKVTHALGRTAWVETVRGRRGGMRLAADPRRLMLGDVVRQLESDVAMVECFGADNRCALTGGCGLEGAIQLATQAFFRELDRYSLADLVDASPKLSGLALWQPITWEPAATRARSRVLAAARPAARARRAR